MAGTYLVACTLVYPLLLCVMYQLMWPITLDSVKLSSSLPQLRLWLVHDIMARSCCLCWYCQLTFRPFVIIICTLLSYYYYFHYKDSLSRVWNKCSKPRLASEFNCMLWLFLLFLPVFKMTSFLFRRLPSPCLGRQGW